MAEEMTYEKAYNELQEIISEIEEGSVNVDELSAKVKRAGELIRFCKEKLFKTEKEVNDTLKQFSDEEK